MAWEIFYQMIGRCMAKMVGEGAVEVQGSEVEVKGKGKVKVEVKVEVKGE
jgi:hypothetical protein